MDKIMRKMADRALDLMRSENYTPYDAVTSEKIKLNPQDLDHLMKICDPEDIAALVGYECLLFYNDFSKFPLTINPSDVNAYRHVAPTDVFAKRTFTGCSIHIEKDRLNVIDIKFNDRYSYDSRVVDFSYDKVLRHAIAGLDKLPKYITRAGVKGQYAVIPFIYEPDTVFNVRIENKYYTTAYDHNSNTYHEIEGSIMQSAFCDSYNRNKYYCNSYFITSATDKLDTDSGIKVVKTDLGLFNEMNDRFNIKKYLSRSYKSNSLNCSLDGEDTTELLDNGGHYDEDKIEKSVKDKIYLLTDRYMVLTEHFFKRAVDSTMITTTPCLSLGSADANFMYEGLVKVINKHINMTESRYHIDIRDNIFIIPTSFDKDVKEADEDLKKNFLLAKLADMYQAYSPSGLPKKIIIVGFGE